MLTAFGFDYVPGNARLPPSSGMRIAPMAMRTLARGRCGRLQSDLPVSAAAPLGGEDPATLAAIENTMYATAVTAWTPRNSYVDRPER
ncbi:hypothetical protein ABZ552_24200 [Nocardia sp. NPDC019219]|uniref:hypothetical protein n=1 Tax=Nocardia sp. NPDC019219 TaxID=3154590 RepID=UPI00340FC53B